MNTFIILIIFSAVLFIFCCFDVKWIKNKFSSIREVKAEVIKKEVDYALVHGKFEMLRSQPKEHYIVTFMCDDKKRIFNVPESAYDNYRVGDCGILKYHGNIILDFSKD